jgi:DnaJ-class molecular chaperone
LIVVSCRRCSGTGVVGEGAYALPCPVCGGTGTVEVTPLRQVAETYTGANDDDGDGDGV